MEANDERLTEAQRAKLRYIPLRLHNLYRRAVTGSRQAAIRVHCLECCAWVADEVRLCSSPGCPMYPYRMPAPARTAATTGDESGGLALENRHLDDQEPADDPENER